MDNGQKRRRETWERWENAERERVGRGREEGEEREENIKRQGQRERARWAVKNRGEKGGTGRKKED